MEREVKALKAHDDAPAIITDHSFEPKDEWWSLCRKCGLARAAHAESTIDTREAMMREHIAKYGEVQFANRQAELERLREGGRVRIGYFSDDNPDDE